ncbi:MAG: type II toxin-antitoxin system HicB family antitoxin [Candidatus Obscuribacterales bacterium]|nr:type II toxin-antitoxin system HicB family antitoxin [Candidatus Obscuribacterales bacterium]
MKNILEIQKHKAVVSYDPEIGMFRGEFLGLSGGADFYGASLRELNKEGQKSLKVYLELCKEKGIEPYKSFSGRFNVRLSPEMHEAATLSAAAQNKSLNDWVSDALRDALVDEDLLEA